MAGFAIAINKAQGLTVKEGVVVHLEGGKRFRPAAKHGLPFVAWTRSESFAMTAFKNLPPWEDFVQGRQSDMLRMRQNVTDRLHGMHARTLATHSELMTPELEERAHQLWTAKQTRRSTGGNAAGPRVPCPACARLDRTMT